MFIITKLLKKSFEGFRNKHYLCTLTYSGKLTKFPFPITVFQTMYQTEKQKNMFPEYSSIYLAMQRSKQASNVLLSLIYNHGTEVAL